MQPQGPNLLFSMLLYLISPAEIVARHRSYFRALKSEAGLLVLNQPRSQVVCGQHGLLFAIKFNIPNYMPYARHFIQMLISLSHDECKSAPLSSFKPKSVAIDRKSAFFSEEMMFHDAL